MPHPSKRRLFFDSYLSGLKTKWFVADDIVEIKMIYLDIWRLNMCIFALISKQSTSTHIIQTLAHSFILEGMSGIKVRFVRNVALGDNETEMTVSSNLNVDANVSIVSLHSSVSICE